jgi:hypothetical protein
MKKLLVFLFSLFFLSSPSAFADDISDFQIEGISIGDSLLDYMTEEEILKEIEVNKDNYSYLKESNKYAEVYLFQNFPTYNGGLSFFIKNNSTNKYISNKNEKYTILSVRGKISYIEDFDGCKQKRGEIVEIVSGMFPNAQKLEQINKYNADPSGNSIFDTVFFVFDSGDQIDVYCTNIEENFRIKNNSSEGLSVLIGSSEVIRWTHNE